MRLKCKKHGFVLLPAVLSIFILGLLGVSLASIYSNMFSTLAAGKAASSAQQFAQIEAEYLKTLGFEDAATGKHTWNTMEKFVGDTDGKEWESQVENVRHLQVSEDNAVDIYKISVRKKGDKTSAYSVEVPLSSQVNSSSTLGVPDYTKAQRLSSNFHEVYLGDGSFHQVTAPDTGYVAIVYSSSGNSEVYINEIFVQRASAEDPGRNDGGSLWSDPAMDSHFLPVKKGDIIKLTEHSRNGVSFTFYPSIK